MKNLTVNPDFIKDTAIDPWKFVLYQCSPEILACIAAGCEMCTESRKTEKGGAEVVIRTKNPVGFHRDKQGNIIQVVERK